MSQVRGAVAKLRRAAWLPVLRQSAGKRCCASRHRAKSKVGVESCVRTLKRSPNGKPCFAGVGACRLAAAHFDLNVRQTNDVIGRGDAC
jgi:hypothetical protein